MKESNNDESLSQQVHHKPKRHNAKLCPFTKRQRIVNALASGHSKRAIARKLSVSPNTVAAVAEQEWLKVDERKQRIAAQAELAADQAWDRINDKLAGPDDISLNMLVPIAGVATDKLLAFRGQPDLTIHHEHHINVDSLTKSLNDFTRAIRAGAIPASRRAEIVSING